MDLTTTVLQPQTTPSGDRPETFARQGYVAAPALIEPALVDFLWSCVHTKFASLWLSGGDRQVPNTPSKYGDPTFDGLLEYLRPHVEAATGLRLLPTYSYFRLYKHGDVLKRHRDRPACEISVSLNIGQAPDRPWLFHVEGWTGAHAASLFPGDALIYRGLECPHWREPFEGERLVQAFLHYVDAEGPHRVHKFDKRPTLMRAKPDGEQQDQANRS